MCAAICEASACHVRCTPLLQAGPIEDVWTIAGKVRKLVLVPLFGPVCMRAEALAATASVR